MCGATDGRIAWAGPGRILDGLRRAARAGRRRAGQPRRSKTTRCATSPSGRRSSRSYASLGVPGRLLPGDARGGAASAPGLLVRRRPAARRRRRRLPPALGRRARDAEPYPRRATPSRTCALYGGLYEGVAATQPSDPRSAANASVAARDQPRGHHAARSNSRHRTCRSTAANEFPSALEFLHLSSADGALWAAAGPVREPPAGSSPGQVTVVRRFDRQSWTQLLGPSDLLSGGGTVPRNRRVTSVAAEPGNRSAWLALDSQHDAAQPSPVAPAGLVTRLGRRARSPEPDLPRGGAGRRIGPKGRRGANRLPGAARLLAGHDAGLAVSPQRPAAERSSPQRHRPGVRGPDHRNARRDEGLPQIAARRAARRRLGPARRSAARRRRSLPENPTRTRFAGARAAALARPQPLVAGTTLELSFHLAVKARVRLIAKRHSERRRRAPRRARFAAGNRELLLRLDRAALADEAAAADPPARAAADGHGGLGRPRQRHGQHGFSVLPQRPPSPARRSVTAALRRRARDWPPAAARGWRSQRSPCSPSVLLRRVRARRGAARGSRAAAARRGRSAPADRRLGAGART